MNPKIFQKNHKNDSKKNPKNESKNIIKNYQNMSLKNATFDAEIYPISYAFRDPQNITKIFQKSI